MNILITTISAIENFIQKERKTGREGGREREREEGWKDREKQGRKDREKKNLSFVPL